MITNSFNANKKWMFVIVLATLILIASLSGLQADSSVTSSPAPVVSIKMDAAATPLSVEERVSHSATVALVTVDAVDPARWNTPDRKALADIATYGQQTGETPYIYQTLHLRVEEYLKHPQTVNVLSVNQIGGEVEGVSVELGEDMDQLTQGQRAVIFFSKKHPAAPADWGILSAYVIDGPTASRKLDKNKIPLDKLLDKIAKSQD